MQQKADKNKLKLDNYLHYLKISESHKQSLKFEQKVHKTIDILMQTINTKFNQSTASTCFLAKAAMSLCESRLTLQYAYILAFFVSDSDTGDNQGKIFTSNLENLNNATERLSRLLETKVKTRESEQKEHRANEKCQRDHGMSLEEWKIVQKEEHSRNKLHGIQARTGQAAIDQMRAIQRDLNNRLGELAGPRLGMRGDMGRLHDYLAGRAGSKRSHNNSDPSAGALLAPIPDVLQNIATVQEFESLRRDILDLDRYCVQRRNQLLEHAATLCL